jgi:ubiquitin-protein ligase
MQLGNRLSSDFDIVSKLQFHDSGILLVKANANLTDWRIKIGNFENGQLSTDMSNNQIDSLDICIRFVGDYPKRPPYVRIISHKVLMTPEHHSIYNNERQSLTVDFWKTTWDPNMSVLEMIKNIKNGLQKFAYIDPSTLKVIKPVEKIDRYIGSDKSSELQKIQLERMKEKEENSKKRPIEIAAIVEKQPVHKYVDNGSSSELQKLHLERIEREKQIKQQERNGPRKEPEPKEQPFVDFPVNINTGTAQWDLIRERQEQKQRQAKAKEILLAKDASEIILTEVKVTNSTVMNAFPIPLEIQGLVFTYLPIKELQKIQTVCVAWYSSAWERADSLNLTDGALCEKLVKRELAYYFTKIGAMKISQLHLGPISFFPDLKGLSNLRELIWTLQKEKQLTVLEKNHFPKLEKLKLSLSTKFDARDRYYFRMEGEDEEEPEEQQEEEEEEEEAEGSESSTEDGEERRERHPDDEIVFDENPDEVIRPKKKKLEVKVPDSLLTTILKKFENLVAVSLPTQCPFDSKVFRSMSQLLSLELQGIKLKLADYRNIGACVQLTHLNLSHTDSFTTKALHELVGLSNITSLDLSESKKVTSWVDLSNFKKLKYLCLGGYENFNQFHNVLPSFPSLESLIIPLTGEKSLECMKSIGGCSNLVELDISTGRKLTGKHLELITQLPKLQILNIGTNISLSSRDIQCLSKLTTLSQLSLPYCRLSDVSVITTLPKLLIVDVRENGISSFNLASMASKLPNTHFQK